MEMNELDDAAAVATELEVASDSAKLWHIGRKTGNCRNYENCSCR